MARAKVIGKTSEESKGHPPPSPPAPLFHRNTPPSTPSSILHLLHLEGTREHMQGHLSPRVKTLSILLQIAATWLLLNQGVCSHGVGGSLYPWEGR